MTIIKIDKDVPLVGDRRINWPMRIMEVGDSFEIPDKRLNTVKSLCNRVAKNKGKKFTVRKQENGKYRCWRIE